LAKILDVDLITLIGESSTMVQTNMNQQGGNAASSMIFNQIASDQQAATQKMIEHLEREIEFLRKFIVTHGG
jgi:hypothetical protein